MKIPNNFISIFSPCRFQSATRADKQSLSAPSVTKTLCQLGATGPGERDRLSDRLGWRICLGFFFFGRAANALMEAGVGLIKHLYVHKRDVEAVRAAGLKHI